MKSRVLWAGLMMASMVQAGAYRWVDDAGNVIYSQTPPPDARRAEEIALPVSPPEQPSAQKEKEVAAKPEGTEYDKAGVAGMDPAQRREFCEKARKNIELLENAGADTAFVTEEKQLVKFSEEEKAQRLERAREAETAYCIDEP